MHVHALGWAALAAVILTMITIDVVGHVRVPHVPSMREAAWWSVAYVAMAVVFGGVVWAVWGHPYGSAYFAGYLTEKALSVDNLFVFVIMMSTFRVPRRYQQEVLLAGVVIALVLRLLFILAGAALVENFSFVFYFFGAWLLWTALSQAREGVSEPGTHEEGEYEPSRLVRALARVVPMTDGYVGGKVLHRHAGRTLVTPMLLVIIAIGTTDVMFAMDSIPAIYSWTTEPYLHYGLAVILGFIGLKLVNHALHTNEVPFVNGGRPWHVVPEPGIGASLCLIVVTMLVTVLASLTVGRRRARRDADQAPQPGPVTSTPA